MEQFLEIVNNLGFPIACVIVLAIFTWKTILSNQETQKEREERLYTELAECHIINEKAIETIAQYAEKLDGIQDDVRDIKTNITVIKSKIE